MLHPVTWIPFILAGVIWALLWAARIISPGSCSSEAIVWAGGILLLLGVGGGLATTPQVAIVGGGLGGVITVTGLILTSTGHC